MIIKPGVERTRCDIWLACCSAFLSDRSFHDASMDSPCRPGALPERLVEGGEESKKWVSGQP